MLFSTKKPLIALVLGSWICACQDPGSNPVTPPAATCADPDSLALSGRFPNKHLLPKRMAGIAATLTTTTWAAPESVSSFFGGKDVKVVFTANKLLYLFSVSGGKNTLTQISHGDESLGGQPGSINSPLLSPDGRRVAFAGTAMGRPTFLLDAVPAPDSGWRVPLDPKGYITADPHWHSEGGKTWVYFATMNGVVKYSAGCDALPGGTYRIEVKGDTALGPMEITGIPGAFRGGLSRDGRWAGTSYATSALFDTQEKQTIVLAGGVQQCNPSMNSFPAGSPNLDYMMILAFGGKYATLSGPISEDQHENLWIYNSKNEIVWRAQRPDPKRYLRWDKPEWSTHPDYATAVALPYGDENNGDLIVVKIGDLAAAPADSLREAQGFLRLAKGGFTSDSYSHLWVGD